MDTQSEEQQLIEKLKAVHGKVITVKIPLDEDDTEKVLTLHLRRPDRMVRKMIQKLAMGEMPEKAVIAGLASLQIGGDDVRLLEQDKYFDAFLTAEDALLEILKVQKATIKKN